MKRSSILAAVTVTAGAVAVAACSAFGVRDNYEQPGYEVVGEIGRSVEIRRYAPLMAAEVTVPAGPEARNQAFRLLFEYISGENQPAQDIAMTAPVELAAADAAGDAGQEIEMTSPVETAAADDVFTMRFFLPAALSERPPEPLDPRVRLVPVPERLVAALRFSGSRSAEELDTRQRLLAAAVDGAADWRRDGVPTALLYDPPWTLAPLRRNEVVVPVQPEGG